jgi:hypothetical protein
MVMLIKVKVVYFLLNRVPTVTASVEATVQTVCLIIANATLTRPLTNVSKVVKESCAESARKD